MVLTRHRPSHVASSAQPEPSPSRPEAIRLALKDWLTGLGLLKA